MGSITYLGPIGAGQMTKAINQIVVAGTYWSVAEGIALGLKAGLNMKKVVQAVGGGAASSWAMLNRSDNMIKNRYPLGFKVQLHRKDLNICKAMAQELGVALSVVEQTLGDYQRLIDQGHGDEDISALYRIKKALFGTDA